MSKKETKFSKGAKVKLKGRPGIHVVTWPMVVPTPCIVDWQFMVVDRVMYKFITDKETYYANEEDCKQ